MKKPIPVERRQSRVRLADFWDAYLQQWLKGDETLHPPLNRWFEGYKGSGPKEIDLSSYPDPYVGDLRGDHWEPQIVMFGVNPGVGYPPLQGRDGIWAQRIGNSSLSRCFQRSPEEDDVAWHSFHKGRSRFWADRMKFADVWLGRSASVHDVLMMELYPWHSTGLSAPVAPPPDLINEHFFEPVAEVSVYHVFAFSLDWLKMARRLKLKCLFSEVMSKNAKGHVKWSLNVFALPSGQTLVVSTYPNSTPPYGQEFPHLLRVLENLDRPQPSGYRSIK